MKQKIFLFCATLFLFISSYGQTDTITGKILKNEISIDATGLLTNIFKGNYSNPFVVQYQRHIKQSAVRLTLNGLYNTNNHLLDTGSYEEYSKSIALKLEYLHYFKLNYHFNLYIGFGTMYSIEYKLTGYPVNSSYINYHYTKTDEMGCDILLGLQYMILPQLGISFEGNFEMLYGQIVQHNYYKISVISNEIPPDYFEKIKSTNLQFIPPINLTVSYLF